MASSIERRVSSKPTWGSNGRIEHRSDALCSIGSRPTPSQASREAVVRRSRSVPAPGLQTEQAYKASVDMPPRFSIRQRLVDPAEKEKRPGCQTYNIGKCSRNGIM